ncbi:MAG TPA: sigma-54 dependent transcriptional regulator [Vicinamibacteria bacterium]|nr:sigma-54 dependent transcriptional regulator [Vicinamibacteria bacterium]
MHALIVDDDLGFALGLAEAVSREDFTAATASSLKEARAEMATAPPDVLITDLQLPDGSGFELLDELKERPDTQAILVTAHASVETAVEALRRNVADYLTKPVDFARIKMVLGNLARTRELREEIGSLRSELRKLGRFGNLVGGSPGMQRVYDLIAKVAPTDASILITGETGTGKERAAEAIHGLSRRPKEPFVPVNCGAMSPTLIESELFGHEKGSFTGADRVHRGYFERANHGTLFLDEITEMSAELQVKLLRVLETGTFMRVGGTDAIRVDARLIAATNRDPAEAVTSGKLREDLLYRLNVFPIHLPPLRERGEDIALLAQHALDQLNKQDETAKRFSPAALDRLRRHAWPGNVRELRNVVQRAFILAENEIGVDELPLGERRQPAGAEVALAVGTSLADAERRLILATLENLDGDKRRAAEILGISLKTLYNRVNQYDRKVS